MKNKRKTFSVVVLNRLHDGENVQATAAAVISGIFVHAHMPHKLENEAVIEAQMISGRSLLYWHYIVCYWYIMLVYFSFSLFLLL